jgi:hypothetical protein
MTTLFLKAVAAAHMTTKTGPPAPATPRPGAMDGDSG